MISVERSFWKQFGINGIGKGILIYIVKSKDLNCTTYLFCYENVPKRYTDHSILNAVHP